MKPSIILQRNPKNELLNQNLWKTGKIPKLKATNMKIKLKANAIKLATEESSNKSKQCWCFFNEEVFRIKPDLPIPHLTHNGLTITNEVAKLNTICATFTQNGPLTPNNNMQYIIEEHVHQEVTPNISEITVTQTKGPLKSISEMKVNKPSGSDNIPPQFFKICANKIVPVLTDLFNLILSSGEMPEGMKEAMIFPLYKGKGAKNIVNNYRPISILPTISKLLEKIVYEKISEFADQNNKLADEQHGYRQHRLTLSATI